jgi:hypothetical protein
MAADESPSTAKRDDRASAVITRDQDNTEYRNLSRPKQGVLIACSRRSSRM